MPYSSTNSNQDWNAPTQPVHLVDHYQPIRVPRANRRRAFPCGCFQLGCLGMFLLVGLVFVYFLAPMRTNFLILGIDRVPDGSAAGRSDTMILVSVVPLRPTIKMLSIPRDLWVDVFEVGEQRINTAHYFAELNQAGTGPSAAVTTISENFEVEVPYYVRVRFDGFTRVVDAMGGVTVKLPEDMAGYPAGQHHLNSEQALAFVRDRSGTDDFFRMSHGQLLIRAVIDQMLIPSSWQYLPDVARVADQAIDTNLPFWQWPRLALAFVRAGAGGIDSRTIGREMITPFTTSGGASVLLPNWELIRPVVSEMFGP
jgi:polyisoprenyl-teichoic acid--peptidoglycan teichoic acid transferase